MGVGAFRRTTKRLIVVGLLTLAAFLLTVPFTSRHQDLNLAIDHVTAEEAWKYASDLNNLKQIDSNVLDLEIINDETRKGVWTYTALIRQGRSYIGEVVSEAKYVARQSEKHFLFTESAKVCKFWMCVDNDNEILFRNVGDSHEHKVEVVVTMKSKCPLLFGKLLAEPMRNDFVHWLHRMKAQLERNAKTS